LGVFAVKPKRESGTKDVEVEDDDEEGDIQVVS
jgi:hypothetical protein